METETATRWLTDAEQCAWRTHLEVNRLLTYQLEKDLQPFGLTMFLPQIRAHSEAGGAGTISDGGFVTRRQAKSRR